MSTFTKCLSGFLGLLLLTVFGSVILTYQDRAYLPSGMPPLPWSLDFPSPWQDYAATYFYWLALGLFVLSLLALFIILFYPRQQTELTLDDKGGRLYLKRSAIEGLVKSTVAANGYMKNPQVSSKLYKKKFKIKVKGEFIPRVDLVDKTQALQAEISQQLQEFLGLSQNLDFKVEVAHVSQQEKRTASSRVD